MQDAPSTEHRATEGQTFAAHLLADPAYSDDISRETLHTLIAYAFAHGAAVASAEAAEAAKSA